MIHTGWHLLEWARESDVGVATYDVVLSMGRVMGNWRRMYQVTCVR
jgi:hypothetical protein